MQKPNLSITRLLLAGWVTLTLSACTSTLSYVEANGTTAKPVFPALTDATRPEGSYVNLDNLHKITAGMTKPQIYELIGVPHYAEGMNNVREWDYIFNVPNPGSTEPVVCQYKVLFDKYRVARTFLVSPQSCTQVLNLNG